MRELYFDLSADEYLPKSEFGGFEGEHNATKITLDLPDRLLLEGALYYMVFEIAKSGEMIFSAPLVPEEKSISVLLPKQVMVSPKISLFAASYQKEGEKLMEIAKTGRVILEIKDPEEGRVVSFSEHGGEVPGLVIEKSLVSESPNPVSSGAVWNSVKILEGQKMRRAEIDENGNLILTLLNGERFFAGNAKGPRGEQGARGEKGEQGARGEKGEKGEQGLRGEKGEQGARGEKGEQGEKGEAAPVRSCANALKGTSSGNHVVLSDVSPIEHEISVVVQPLDEDVFLFDLLAEIERESKLPQTNQEMVVSSVYVDVEIDSNIRIDFEDGFFVEIESNDVELGERVNGLKQGDVVSVEQIAGEWDTDFPPHINLYYRPKAGEGQALCITVQEGEKAPAVYTAEENGTVKGIFGKGETITLIADAGFSISAEYHRDLNHAFSQIQENIAPDGNEVKY